MFVGSSFTDLTKAIYIGKKNIWHQLLDSMNIILSGSFLFPEGSVAFLQEGRSYRKQGGRRSDTGDTHCPWAVPHVSGFAVSGMGHHLGVIDFPECAWHPHLLFSSLERGLRLDDTKTLRPPGRLRRESSN